MAQLKLGSLFLTVSALGAFSTFAADEPAAPKMVALIFDDGPTQNTAAFLKIFKQEGIVVTFNQIAGRVRTDPDTAQSVLADGHEIGNHSLNHGHPAVLNDSQLEDEVLGAQKVFQDLLGYSPKWYWRPFVENDSRLGGLAKQGGFRVFFPGRLVVTQDYDSSVTGESIYERATTGITDGSVILMHEWRAETLEQIPAIIQELKSQGFSFATFDKMNSYLNP